MHSEYSLPQRVSGALQEAHAEGIRKMVRGMHCVASYEHRAPDAAAAAAAPKIDVRLWSNRRRFFQLSHDLTILRWSWREYLLLDEVVRITPARELGPYGDILSENPLALQLHAGTPFDRRVLTLECDQPETAANLIDALRQLRKLTSLGEREFTMYLLELFKLQDASALGHVTAKNRMYALGFLNLVQDRDAEARALESIGLTMDSRLDFRECASAPACTPAST